MLVDEPLLTLKLIEDRCFWTSVEELISPHVNEQFSKWITKQKIVDLTENGEQYAFVWLTLKVNAERCSAVLTELISRVNYVAGSVFFLNQQFENASATDKHLWGRNQAGWQLVNGDTEHVKKQKRNKSNFWGQRSLLDNCVAIEWNQNCLLGYNVMLCL